MSFILRSYFCVVSKEFFVHGPIKSELFLNISIWLLDGIIISITNRDQNGSENNGNEDDTLKL